MKRNVCYVLLFCIVTASLCFFGGCKEKDDGVFVPNGSLYEGITIESASPNGDEEQDVSDNTDAEEGVEPTPTETPSEAVVDKSSAIPVTMTIKDYGVIKLKLYPNVAPVTVENFVNLASEGFYDGLTFHRVIKDFMIQGGNPTAGGNGGSDKKIIGEFLYNGIENNLSHKRGVISMARYEADFNSATSQFFICQQDRSESLDGLYAAFGEVTEGMEIVDAIASVSTDDEDKPLTDVVIESIKVES